MLSKDDNKNLFAELKFKTIYDLPLIGKTVLVRADFNVPLRADGSIQDVTKIERALPTLWELRVMGCKIILMSHLGKPTGRDPHYSLKTVHKFLQNIFPDIIMAEDCIGPGVEAAVQNLAKGQLLLLENLRYHREEADNNDNFAKQLSRLGEFYINDAFSVAHRSHASVVGIPRFIPAGGGLLLAREVSMLERALKHSQHPKLAIIGGAKVSSKINMLSYLSKHFDHLFIGGAMANTFLQAQGTAIGKSVFEPDYVKQATEILRLAHQHNCKIHLPQDVVAAQHFSEEGQNFTLGLGQPPVAESQAIPADYTILDIGANTRQYLAQLINQIKTVVWNGPMGMFEQPQFARGSEWVAQKIAEATQALGSSVMSIAGGGETVAVINQAQVIKDFTYVSMGGGAFLEWLNKGGASRGSELPGLSALLPR